MGSYANELLLEAKSASGSAGSFKQKATQFAN
jgi:hypothetical protein